MAYDIMDKEPIRYVLAIIGNDACRGNACDCAIMSDLTMEKNERRLNKLFCKAEYLIDNIQSYLKDIQGQELINTARSVSQVINKKCPHMENRTDIDGVEEYELRRYIESQLRQQYEFVDELCKTIKNAQLCTKHDAHGIIPELPYDLRIKATSLLGNTDLENELSIEYHNIGKSHERYRMNIINGDFPENCDKMTMRDELLEYSDILRGAEEILALEKMLGKYGVDIKEITIPHLSDMTLEMSGLDNSILKELKGSGIKDEQIKNCINVDYYSGNKLVDPVYVPSMDIYGWFLEGSIQIDMDRENYDPPEFRYNNIHKIHKYALALEKLNEIGFDIGGVPEAPIIFDNDEKGPTYVKLSDDEKDEQHLVERKVLNHIIGALTPEKQRMARELIAPKKDIVDVFCEIRYRREEMKGLPIMLEIPNNGI